MTSGGDRTDRPRTAAAAALSVGAILAVSALAGDSILTLVGTSLGAFRVAGGIVLLLLGLSMLGAEHGSLLLGLLLAAVAIEMMAGEVKQLFPGLAP